PRRGEGYSYFIEQRFDLRLEEAFDVRLRGVLAEEVVGAGKAFGCRSSGLVGNRRADERVDADSLGACQSLCGPVDGPWKPDGQGMSFSHWPPRDLWYQIVIPPHAGSVSTGLDVPNGARRSSIESCSLRWDE